MRNKLKSLLVFAVVLLPGITGLSVCFISNENPIKADLRYLLPDSGRNPADRTADFYTDRLSRELIFLAETGDEDRDSSREEASVSSDSQFSSNEDAAAQKSAAYLTEKLSELPFITLRNSPEMMSRGRFLFEHRYALGADYFMKDGAVDEESLREEVLNVLYEPFSGVTEKEINADPFFTMRHYLKNGGGFTLDEKGLLKLHTQSGKSAYLVSAFINREHLNRDEKQKLNALARDFASSSGDFAGSSNYFTGSYFFTEEASEASMRDIRFIGTGSAVILIVLLLLFFKSWRPILKAAAVVNLAIFSAAGSVVTCFGSIHVITLAIGSTLAGISFDYVLHVLVRRKFSPEEPVKALRKALLRPLLLSLFTSVTAYAITGLTGLAVLRELAVFASAGLVTAFLLSYYWLSLDNSFSGKNTDVRNNNGDGCFFRAVREGSLKIPRMSGAVMLVVFLTAGVITVSTAEPDDCVSSLGMSQTGISLMDRHVNESIGGFKNYRWYILEADSLENALESCEDLLSALSESQKSGVTAPCSIIPSAKKQRQSIESYHKAYASLKSIYAEAGIILDDAVTGVYEAKEFRIEDAVPFSEFSVGPDSLLLRVNAGDSGLIEKLGGNPDIRLLDRRKEWNEAFGIYRQNLNYALIGVMMIILAVSWGIGRIRGITVIFLPLLGGLAAAVTACQMLGLSFSLFVTVALFTVTGLGADYGIFIYNMKREQLTVTLGTVMLAWFSTEAACAMLMLSDIPAVKTVGTVITSGLAGVFVLSCLLKTPEIKEWLKDKAPVSGDDK